MNSFSIAYPANGRTPCALYKWFWYSATMRSSLVNLATSNVARIIGHLCPYKRSLADLVLGREYSTQPSGVEAEDGGFPTVATGKTCHALQREPPLVMHRCGRPLLSKSPTKFYRVYSSSTTLAAAESATPLPRPNALTLIHKSSALLPSILSPTPKHPVESLGLWTDLLNYAHNASITHKDSASDENRRARIVGTFIPRSFSKSCMFSFPTFRSSYSAWDASGLRSI